MTSQSVTLRLPDPIMHRARQSAEALQRPLEEVLAALLNASLPEMEEVPPDMQAELLRMTWLSDKELWEAAHSRMPHKDQEQMRYLAELQAQRPLAPHEQEPLEALRREYGRVTLRKARAYALLSLRGGRPLLAES